VLAARADIVAQGIEPAGVRQIKENLLATGNPFGLPAADRFKALESADLFSPKADVLYYVGCETAYHRPAIARSMIKVLKAAKAKFTLLRDERSTGKPLTLLGYRDDALAMAQSLAAQIRATGCKTLVTACPSAYDAFVTDFPAMGVDLSGIEILHASQYLDRLVQQKAIKLQKSSVVKATVLDGTYLGRTHKILNQPRRVLQAIPGVELCEMGWTRELAYAAGEPGGVLRLLHPELSKDLCERVLGEVRYSGAELLVTTCPATQIAIQETNPADVAVRDLVEVVADAIG
jgi:Fe-S oxidoreductase